MAVEMNSPVMEFFNGSQVLVTGATGFMGKVLIEKLLRVCKGVDRLYVLIRVKKGKEPATRLKELFDDPIFERLKSQNADVIRKVTVVPGDCSLPRLGLANEDYKHLTEVLTHVFHGAATVRFDEKLRAALNVNVQGVREMMRFCSSCTGLKSILHISTAYSNCPIQTIQEQFYDPPMTGESAIELMKCLDDSKLEVITPEIIKPWPNTYSFSKAVAEDVVQKFGEGLPIGVFRPSIVIGTATEPVSGWIDNLYGPTGVVVGVGAGLLRVLYADGEIKADLVPVDMAVNALICASWDIGQRHKNETRSVETDAENCDVKTRSKIPIYHFVTSSKNPLKWKEFLYYNFHHGMKIPSIKAIWYYTLTITKIWPLYKLLTVLYHLIPALIMDAGLLLSGNKAQMWRAYSKIHKFSTVISFFSTKEWRFGEDNTLRLWDSLSIEDRTIFDFDMRSLNWNKFFKENVHGIRMYLFQDPPSTLPAARRKMFLLHIAHRILQLVLFSVLVWVLYTAFSTFLENRPDLYTEYSSSSRWASRKVLVST